MINLRLILLFLTAPFWMIGQNNPPITYTLKSIIVEDTDHVFLNLYTNTASTKNQTGWDIALYNEMHEIGGMVNENRGVKAWRVFKDTTQFTALTLADTTQPVSNSSSVFYLGALDTMYTGSLASSFNIGIGDFYQSNLVTVPTKMYIIKFADNSYGKFYISYKSSGGRNYTIRYANINNTDAQYITVPKSASPLTRHYKYLKFSNSSILNDFEPAMNDWDIVFRKYTVGSTTYPIGILTNNAHNLIRLSNITGFPAEYLLQGVVKTEAYEAIGDPATVTYDGRLNSSDPISRNHNQIGEKWFDVSKNQPVSGRSYFLKDQNNRLWHLVFTTYDAASKTLNIAYQNKGSASIGSGRLKNDFIITQHDGKLEIFSNNIHDKNAKMTLLDITGRVLLESKAMEQNTIDVSKYKNQILFLRIQDNQKIYSEKIGIY